MPTLTELAKEEARLEKVLLERWAWCDQHQDYEIEKEIDATLETLERWMTAYRALEDARGSDNLWQGQTPWGNAGAVATGMGRGGTENGPDREAGRPVAQTVPMAL